MRPAAPPACEGQGQDVTKTHTLRTGLRCGAPPRRPDGRLWRPNQRGTCPQPVCLADARGKRQAGSGRARRQRRLWTLPQGGQYGINRAATRACGYCASATLRDKMVASGQILMAGHCAAPLGPPTSCRPAIPRARSGGRVPRRDRIRIAAGRLARRAGLERHFGPPPGSSTRRRRSARRPDSPAIPRAFVRCSMSWTGWPRIPVQPGRSRTDRQTCGGCGPAADLPADTNPWHQCRAGISDQSFPRTTGTPPRPVRVPGTKDRRSLARPPQGSWRPAGSGRPWPALPRRG